MLAASAAKSAIKSQAKSAIKEYTPQEPRKGGRRKKGTYRLRTLPAYMGLQLSITSEYRSVYSDTGSLGDRAQGCCNRCCEKTCRTSPWTQCLCWGKLA